MNLKSKHQLVEFLQAYSNKIEKIIEAADAVVGGATPPPVSDTPVDMNDANAAAEDIKVKINSIRSGKSLNDGPVAEQFKKYVADLKVDERKALSAFLDGLSKVLTGAVQATDAPSADDAGVKMTSSGSQKTRSVKPNIIKTLNGLANSKPADKENTSSPIDQTPAASASKVVPIVPKKGK